LKVEQLMSRTVFFCSPDDALADAVKSMWDHDVGCLPVLDEERRVVGMITDRDACMAALLQGRRLGEMPVSSAMARPVWSCHAAEDVAEAGRIMREKRVRRLPVIDEEERLVGLITLGDLAAEAAREEGPSKRLVSAEQVAITLAAVVESRGGRSIVAGSGATPRKRV
jgi:CBS domain-containing protein